MGVTRRTLIAGGVGAVATGAVAALVENDVLPGRPMLHRALGLNGDAGAVPQIGIGPVVSGRVSAPYVDSDAEWRIAYPPGSRPGDRLPTVIVLHGAGSSAARTFDELGLPQFLAASKARMALAAVDGGRSYWQQQPTGDTGKLVLERLVPLLASRGLDVSAPAFLGWSMGGYGALRLSSLRLQAGAPVGPVIAVSPALWTEWGEVVDGAFTGQRQYDDAMALIRAELMTADPPVPVRIDCGAGDPFFRHVQAISSQAKVETHWTPGAHDAAYWTRELPGQLAWLDAQLRRR